METSGVRVRWAAIGAAIAVALGGGALGVAHATVSSGDRDVFVPITPCRLFDTRPSTQVGPRSSPLGAGDTYTQPVTGANGDCAIPSDAKAVSLNVTAVNGTAPSYLTIWPSDAPRPTASNLNWLPGAPPTPNKVDVKLSASGTINLFNLNGTVDVLADVAGYYADHNHDDRYYTKAEVDAMLAANGPLAWGFSRGDGSLRVKSPNVVQVLHPGTGQYCVVFSPPVDASRLEAAVFSGGGSGLSITGENLNGIGGADACAGAPNQEGLQVQIWDAHNGVLADARFSFVVP